MSELFVERLEEVLAERVGVRLPYLLTLRRVPVGQDRDDQPLIRPPTYQKINKLKQKKN